MYSWQVVVSEFWTVGFAVDDHAASTADTFTAIVVEGNGLFVVFDQLFVQLVHHFQERHVWAQTVHVVRFHFAAVSSIALTPNVNFNSHDL